MHFTSSSQAYRITRDEWPWRFSPGRSGKLPGGDRGAKAAGGAGGRSGRRIAPLLFWDNDGHGPADAETRALAAGRPIRPADCGAVGSFEEYGLLLIEATLP